MLLPRRTWLVYLIISTSILIFTISYRQREHVQRIWHDHVPYPGNNAAENDLGHDTGQSPGQPLEAPYSQSPLDAYSTSAAVPAGQGRKTSTTATAQTSLTASSATKTGSTTTRTDAQPTIDPHAHPIDSLLLNAKEHYDELLAKSASGVEAAANSYRERRGRHPPPHFEKWVAFAEEKDGLIIEDMFDQIYHDLEPFWGVNPAQIRSDTSSWPYVISIRNGKAEQHGKDDSEVYLSQWLKMFQEIESYLPDVDMAFNANDQPRVVVPWVTMKPIMDTAVASRTIALPPGGEEVVNEYSSLEPFEVNASASRSGLWKDDTSYWWLARHACPESSAARGKDLDTDFSSPPEFDLGHPQASLNGYVSNWTLAKSVCEHPMLRNQHGAFVEPSNNSAMVDLFPLFGHAKIQDVNNDILVPSFRYWDNDDSIEVLNANQPWREKEDKVLWRGRASGGEHDESNWTRFHRHRLVAMLNGTLISAAEGVHLPTAGTSDETASRGTSTQPLSSSASASAGSVSASTTVNPSPETTALGQATTKSDTTSAKSYSPSQASMSKMSEGSSVTATEAVQTAPPGYNRPVGNVPEADPASSPVYNNPYNQAPSQTADNGPAQQSVTSAARPSMVGGQPMSISASASGASTPAPEIGDSDDIGQSVPAGSATTTTSTSSSAATVSSASTESAIVPSETTSSISSASGHPFANGGGMPPIDYDQDDLHASAQGNTIYKRDDESPKNFPLPTNASTWPLSALADPSSRLGPWINNISDVGFVDYMCDKKSGTAQTCKYLEPYFEIAKYLNLSELYGSKYLLDVDAAGFSARFRSQLRSGSVPIKGTIFSEWHDSRLIAWKHFVPMDNTFIDIYGILEYFFGWQTSTTKKPGHDKVAEDIAGSGKRWAAQVLRKEDMLIYMYRLVLEFARISDDRREQMMYIEDLA